jgi:hypothetical protein
MDEPHGVGYYVVGGAVALLIVGFILFMFFIMFRGMYRALFWSRDRLREEQVQDERERQAMGSFLGSDHPGYDPDESRASLFWSYGWFPVVFFGLLAIAALRWWLG